MIFTSVDVEALRYLHARGEIDPEFERFLLENISFGYQRELTYRHRDGWFNAHVCDNKSGSLWLTSYCLTVFSQARELVTIDPAILSKAAGWILGHQQADGGWKPVGWVNNSSLYGGYTAGGDYALTAFVTLALARYGSAAESAMAAARSYLESRLDGATSPISLAMGAYALAVLKSPLAPKAVDRLLAMAKQDSERRLYWDDVPVETTSYAVLALYELGDAIRFPQAASAASWIAAQKNSRGGFGNTQDTVMALRALVRDALTAMESTDVNLRIARGGEALFTTRIGADNIDIVQTFEIEPGLPVEVSCEGKGSACLQMARIYHMPVDLLRSRGGLEISVDFGSTRAAVGDRVTADVQILYRGSRPETNMAIAEIGIPTGLRPDRGALDALVGKDQVRRVDVSRRAIIFYLDKIVAQEAIRFSIPFTAVFPAQPAPAPSKAYDYYDLAIEAMDESLPMVIGELGRDVAFLRADGNFDGSVDIADALLTLQYLFGGLGALPCSDALDVDDTGVVDLTDALNLLAYLFLGGSPPAQPFPKIGEDTTQDELRCSIK